MPAILALVTEVMANLPGMISAGMDVYALFTKTKAVIAANIGPGNDDWNALDAQVKALQTTVRDTSGDVRG